MKILLTILTFLIAFSINAQEKVAVEKIEIKLYYNQEGSFSGDLFEEKPIILWNTIIGEGMAESPSDSFLVQVKIRGPRDKFIEHPIELKILEKNSQKMIVSKKFTSFLFGKSGIIHQAVLISDFNCTPITIFAGKIKKSVNFSCGE